MADERRDLEPRDKWASVPDHVDPRLVVDVDYLDPPGVAEHGDVYRAWHSLHVGPDIVWTPRHGGHWLLTRADDVRWAQETYQILSHEEFFVPRGSAPPMPPATVDPPDTSRYRAILNPFFTRGTVSERYEPLVRALSAALIEGIRPAGHCDFVPEFARIMPVSVFLGIVDLPVERREEFLLWGARMAEPATAAEYQRRIADYLAQVLDERAERPRGNLLSAIAAWRKNPRFRDESEVIGMAMLVFAGGLDTVAASLSFAMLELARRPELQARLRDDPATIERTVEEFLRRHALSSTARIVKEKCVRKGACMMPGDMVLVSVALSGIDDRRYDRPFTVDPDCGPVPHNTFGNGPHRCLGEHLARMELQVFLEEWFARMPEVRLDPARPPRSHGGAVEGVAHLDLIWSA